jgi:hypothetical protein
MNNIIFEVNIWIDRFDNELDIVKEKISKLKIGQWERSEWSTDRKMQMKDWLKMA